MLQQHSCTARRRREELLMAAPRPLFIAATRRHVGKTTVSLAVLSGLRKRFGDRVGFVKPVGQQHVPVGAKGIRVDKDVQLMKEYFGLNHLSYEDMSPVLVPRDYTKRFIDGGVLRRPNLENSRCGKTRARDVGRADLRRGGPCGSWCHHRCVQCRRGS